MDKIKIISEGHDSINIFKEHALFAFRFCFFYLYEALFYIAYKVTKTKNLPSIDIRFLCKLGRTGNCFSEHRNVCG